MYSVLLLPSRKANVRKAKWFASLVANNYHVENFQVMQMARPRPRELDDWSLVDPGHLYFLRINFIEV